MYSSRTVKFIKNATLIFIFNSLPFIVFSQQVDSLKSISHFSGAVTATNNGISLLPNLTLGRPAIIFDLSVGKNKLSFEPQLRFAWDGKPWSFVLWWRYKMIKTPHFSMNIGAHPAFTFRYLTLANNGVASTYLTSQRYLASEITPTFHLGRKVSVGLYYLYSHGLGKDATVNTNFIAVRGWVSHIALPKQLELAIAPQAYYLKLDTKEGYYISSTTSLIKRNSHFSLSSITSKAIKTNINGKNFVWNVALIYSFSKNYMSI